MTVSEKLTDLRYEIARDNCFTSAEKIVLQYILIIAINVIQKDTHGTKISFTAAEEMYKLLIK